jgi:hypothetical protein
MNDDVLKIQDAFISIAEFILYDHNAVHPKITYNIENDDNQQQVN